MDSKKTMKKKQATAKGKFTRIWNVFKAGEMRGDDVEVLKGGLKDMEEAYAWLEEKHADYIEELDSEEEGERPLIEESQKQMEEVYRQLNEGRSAVVALNKLAKKEAERKEVVIKKNANASLIRVKKLDAPKFGGELTEFPSFKRDYKIHMEPVYGTDPYALKKCLFGDALSAIQGNDDDFTAMMARLELKYGRPDRLADAVVTKLKRLKVVGEGEDEKFIQMVDTVENCWLEMQRLDLKAEMSNVTIVSEIEKLLPKTILREWVIQKEEFQLSTSKDQFPDFLKFLLRERMAIEYMSKGSMRKSKELKANTNLVERGNEESKSESSTIELLLQSQKQSEEALRKAVEGLTQVIQAVGDTRSTASSYNRSDSTNKKCWLHDTNNHDIEHCSAFTSQQMKQRIDTLKKNGACFCCLKKGHLSRQCLNKKPCNTTHEGQVCNRFHHPIVHQAYAEGTLFHVTTTTINKPPTRNTILMISSVSCNNQLLTTFWDPGSNTSLITRRAANLLGLKGKQVTLTITKAGNEKTTTESKEYVVPLTDEAGKIWYITAYEMLEIAGRIRKQDMTVANSLFDELKDIKLDRSFGHVDLLIGSDCCSILPNKIAEVDNLQLLRNQFGYCFRGSHPSFDTTAESNSCQVVMHVAGTVINDRSTNHIIDRNLDKILESFLDRESLGTRCYPKCGNCQCKKCPIGTNNYTIEEGRELKMIEEGLKYDPFRKEWTAHYPWKKNPAQLLNNFRAVFGRLKSTEKRLQKAGDEYAETYHKQIVDMIERNVARKLSTEEIENAEVVQYIPHHEVLKPSKSTPIRIVFNSSAKFMGQSLNDYWAKGPCMMNDLYSILLRFRQYCVGIAGDLKKMYNTIKLSERDQGVHRFLWRDLDSRAEPDHYCLTTVTFGDRPSAAIAATALKKTAEMSKEEVPKVNQLVERDSFVDDLITSTKTSDEADQLMEDAERALEKGGFKVKEWIVSGSTRIHNINDVTSYGGEKVLGMLWNPEEDSFRFEICINVEKRNKKKKEHLEIHDVAENIPTNLTRRMILSQIASIYDPLGLITPVTLGAKILMRNLCIKNESIKEGRWDVPIDQELRDEAVQFFSNLIKVEMIRFSRCIKPQGSIGKPTLVIFSDGSDAAYGAAAYVRWEVSNSIFEANLLTSKNRIAPRRKLSIPQLELCGALIGARLRKTIVENMDFSFDRILHLVDSSIVRAQIQKESYGFATFVAIRIGEIQSLTDPVDWWWIPTGENPADMVTRVNPAENLSTKSMWQRGPSFLTKPVENWPISKEMCQQELPDRIGVIMSVQDESCSNTDVRRFSDVPLERFNDFKKLITVISILIKVAERRTFKGAGHATFSEKEKAEREMVKFIQQDIPDWKKRYRRLGPEKSDEGLVVVGVRMSKWLKDSWNPGLFVLLPLKNRFTVLYAKHIHDLDHAAVNTTVTKIRSKYWVRRCAPLVRTIKSKCIICRKKDKALAGQIMGPLPMKRMQPSPPFFHSAVDLFGPFVIRGSMNKRSRSKGFGAMFTDLTSRACHIEVAEGYDTSSFINALRRFHSIRGIPKTMLSDPGTQLVATSKEFARLVENWDLAKIYQFGERVGTTWSTTKAANATWENGCCEAMVKQAKRMLMLSLGSEILTILELQTVFYEIADLLNQRPIGVKISNPDQGSYLCPNDLLLGRATSSIPSGFMEQAVDVRHRWQFVQTIVNSFWKKWMRDFFHTLIVRSKWHTSKRNLHVGDLVLVKDSSSLRGQWKLPQVCNVFTSGDNVVRNVAIRYKQQSPGDEYKGVQDTVIKRSAHSLVVLLPVEEQDLVGGSVSS